MVAHHVGEHAPRTAVTPFSAPLVNNLSPANMISTRALTLNLIMTTLNHLCLHTTAARALDFLIIKRELADVKFPLSRAHPSQLYEFIPAASFMKM
jgi:hypothetical protein